MDEKYVRFCALFEEAESRIKRFEKIELEPCLPAINQLRYAACHIKESLQADPTLNDDDEKSEKTCITSAEHHCHRAIKDITEASIDYIATAIAKFYRGYFLINIKDEVENHLELKKQIRAAVEYSSNCNHDKIEDSTEMLCVHMDEILHVYSIYDLAQDDLNKRSRLAAWKIFMAVAGLLVAIAALA